ncbi:hypothetical protein DesyoDRAFT_2065 [Desulfosporosinus youngiae DSM 17734]|uniref:Uncharacterized protein n=1 Tax=Desulfosporosinus youngiae DSM 17734 TaxID=768710 RepID=H5XU64_9FIRM|nr:hypothetical protein DesyoDRAFT_2065 [Desulfosporosinus youngiae DSM 17734]
MKTIESCNRASLKDKYTLDNLEKVLYPIIPAADEDCVEKLTLGMYI